MSPRNFQRKDKPSPNRRNEDKKRTSRFGKEKKVVKKSFDKQNDEKSYKPREKKTYRNSEDDQKPKRFQKDKPRSFDRNENKKDYKHRDDRKSYKPKPFHSNDEPTEENDRKPKRFSNDKPYSKRTEKRDFDRRDDRKSYKSKPSYEKDRNSGRKSQGKGRSEGIRLNRFLSNAGICSRREADEYIKAGLVKVNGEVIIELGTKIRPSDEVKFNNELVRTEKKVYILLNKPKDYVTTTDDERGRKTVMQLISGACREKVFPVGRLDRNTTGVLLITNDGEMAAKLTHPKYSKKKIYHVFLDKNIKLEDMDKLVEGVEDEGEMLHADLVSYADPTDKTQVGVEIHSGQNRVVRRMFEALGYRVIKLDRVYFAGLTKKGLPRGRWRFLTPTEINMLKMGAFK